MMKFSEAIRKKLGWCPNAAMAGAGRRYAAPDGKVGTVAEGGREVVEGALVDYGPIGTPGRLFLLLVAGACFIGCLFAMAPAGGLLLLAIMLGYSALEFYGAVRRACIEITRDAVTIRRPLFPSIVIPKDAVVKAEVKENKPPISPWLLAVALAALLVSAAGSVYAGFENPTSMRFIFGVAAAIFFPVIIYRTCVRTRYPQALVITTAKKRVAVIYTDDPGRIARMLGVAE
ncbi:MAG: hypothetical protein CVV31_10305 [Methanomicrobiales archaeon HGW-Methanomicrobiales-2]|jgi:hypothetical protein|nr:MAG: hypothetical protein CVV31_10305 [Methanomicrobiales archaeon HGW-Methanomicrobiales-2]